MVEGAPLLREYTREGIVGSNPILSAIKISPDFNSRNITPSATILASAIRCEVMPCAPKWLSRHEFVNNM